MALVAKNDVTQIFAIQAPSVDLPPTFANYPRGWDAARSNNGKPTIKQFNYIQQRTDQNVLWVHQNGAALPYDATMEYAEGAVVVKDGELQKKQGAGWVFAANKGYNLDYFVSGKSYPLHAEIMLENGDIVKSTIPNNTNDPNVDMTGWVNTNDASQISISNDKTQADKNSLTVDLLDFIPKSEWQAIKDGTSSYDCTTALTQAVATGKKVTIGQSGTYKLNTPYTGATDFELEATAPNVVLDGNDNVASYVIQNSGTVTKLAATFANPAKHQTSSTLSDVSGLKTGDWLCFYCPTDFSYSQWRAYYRAGEWKQIRAIVGNDVWFTKPFMADYTGLALDLYKLNSVKCAIKNVKLVRKNKLTGFVRFALSSNASDSDVQIDTELLQAIIYDRCVHPISTGLIGSNLGTGVADNDYAVVFANCQHGRVFKADVYARRHAVALGGGIDVCSVPISDFRCYDSVLSADLDAAVGAADMHGNIRDSSYEDCIIYGGTNIGGGEDCYYKRCIIHSDAKGVCGFGREILGGNMGWIDCEYHSNGNPQPSGQAVISFGGNDSTTITEKTTLDANIKVSGKVFGGAGYGAAVSFTKVRNRGSLKKINPMLDGVEFNNTSKFAYLLNMDVVSGIADSDRIVVDNISGNMPSTNLVYAPATTPDQVYLNKPMRLQRRSGVVTITTTAANFTTSPLAAYPFNYPRKPITLITPRGVDGAVKNVYGGRRSVTFGINSQAIGGFVAVISSDTALTGGDVIEIAYQSEINEC